MFVREWHDGWEVDAPLLVRRAEARPAEGVGESLHVELGDRTGVAPLTLSADVPAARELCRPGTVVWVRGRYASGERGPSLALVAPLRAAAESEYDPAALFDGPPHPAGQMEADLRELVATVQCPHLRGLLDAVLGEHSPLWPLYRDAPAAKRYHQAYRHGLLEHSLSVAQGVHSACGAFPGIDHDVAVTGALLHDIGKLDAYTSGPGPIDMTDLGRLQGEIPLGYYRVRRLIEGLPGFPPDTAAAVLHIILAHHGSLEHGSPVVPCTREATLVHMIDNLGGKLGSFDRLEKELPAGATWSSWDRALGSGAYFATRRAA
ncbi:MAG TPA: HD domain-containing protein [Solirubrobacteraceae bacterium]